MALKHPLPNRPLSRLERKHFSCRNNNYDDRRDHDDLAKELGLANNMVVTADFPLSQLLPSPVKRGERRPVWGEFGEWPGFDHVRYYRRGRKGAAVLTQPYDTPAVQRLKFYAAERGLSVNIPPNPFASFWYPGWTYCVLITAPDFGPVTWLYDQLVFATHGQVT